MVLTEQEQQLIECIRRLKEPDEFSVTITRGNRAWEIDMSAGKMKARGVGATFDAAWDNVTAL
ncbi:MAG: hypothetical protein WAK55_06370 [Xanthobacteraceae bacterium]